MGIRVNTTDRAVESEAIDIEPVPAGKYLVVVSNAEVKEVVSNEKGNKGEPYMSLEVIIEADKAGGVYEGRKMWTNVMLFGEAFSAVQIMKALGRPVSKTFDFPEAGELMGEHFVVRASKLGETTDKNDPSKTYSPKNEIKAFFSSGVWDGRAPGTAKTATQPAKSGKSLLP